MRALVFDLSIPKYIASLATGRKVKSLQYGKLSCLSLRDVEAPVLPGDDWVTLAPRRTGLCGSDLGTIFFKQSPSLSVFASMPAVLGHEILANVVEVGASLRGRLKEGDRVVVDPVLSCEVRGAEPCRRCAIGEYGTCQHHGDGLGPILGFSRKFPGGFSERLIAHGSQVFRVSDAIDDDRGVLAEPAAVCVHAVLAHPPRENERILVIGGGVIAFLTVWALTELFPSCEVTLLAPEDYQRELARKLGARHVLGEGPHARLLAEVARKLDTREMRPILGRGFLAGGYDRVFDCIGSPASLDDALRVTSPGGTLVLVGAAGVSPSLDLTTLWTKEIRFEGTAYYGWESWKGDRRRTFDITLELLAGTSLPLAALITHRFPLDEYARAIEVNLDRRGTRSVKAVMSP